MVENPASNNSVHSSPELAGRNEKIVFRQSSTKRLLPAPIGKIWYLWSLLVVGFLVGGIAAPTMLVLDVIKKREWFYPLCEWGARAWLRWSGVKVKLLGLENLAPDEAYVFISNHRSYLDTAALFGHTPKKMGLVAKKELLKVPVFGRGMQWVNILPIDRTNAKRAYETMDTVREKINEGVSFAVFAEGTRALPGELLPFKRGAFRVAIETGKRVVPVAIRNSDNLMGKKTGVAAPGTIEVVFMPPVTIASAENEASLEVIRDQIRSAVAAELDKQ